MKTTKQRLGEMGEIFVTKKVSCPHCAKKSTLRRLPPNFKCADLICDFCGFLAQVKTSKTEDIETLPKTILGAAWGPQEERMNSGIFFPLYLVLVNSKGKKRIYYLPKEAQTKEIFIKRKPLSENARRAGWTGFYYDLTQIVQRNFEKVI